MKQLQQIINDTQNQFKQISSDDWAYKSAPDKWSRKEILGHLVDSARINLQRFTEVQYFESPYSINPYAQDHQVIANIYHNQSLEIINEMWISLNKHISYLISQRSEEDLSREVVLPDGKSTTVNWLVEEYIEHLHHHLNQILGN